MIINDLQCDKEISIGSTISKDISVYRVAQKERNTYDQLFQEHEGHCVHYCVYNSFSSKMTPRSLILMKSF